MTFEIHPANPSDAASLAAVFLASFSDPFNQRLFPPSPDVTIYWTEQFTSMLTNPRQRILKAVETKAGDSTSVIVALAVWELPLPPSNSLQSSHRAPAAAVYPPSSDAELCASFFEGMETMHERIMSDRPHYYLNILGTHPAYHGRGLASRLLRWGLDRADAQGLETYLSASPVGRPLYEKFGFRLVEAKEIIPGYVQGYMLRAPGRRE